MALLSAFNPHEFSERTIRTVATGREADLKEILDSIRANLGGRTLQHLILSAPRGYGKSFMMRHVQIEVERIAREESLPLAVLLMPEEMPHVKEPETLIRELTRALTGGAGAEAELSWHEDDGAAFEAAALELEAAIQAKLGSTGLCVAMVENFDVLLRRAFPKDVDRSRLRAFLSAPGSRLMLIAASASGAFDRNYDARLYQAFREVILEPWSPEDCLDFFDRQRRDADKPPLGDLARARAKAVALFIGGTPRLATLLGDVLLGDDLLRAAELLRRLVDELTPYYKERIEALPGRSQKLLDALLRGGEPATQSEIARRVKAGQSAIAGPFNDLVKERIVRGEKAPGSAEILYRVADRVFAHYYRFRIVDHGKSLCPLEGLVDLLAASYSLEEQRERMVDFARDGWIEEARLMARLIEVNCDRSKIGQRWILTHLWKATIPNRLKPLASAQSVGTFDALAEFVRNGDIDSAFRCISAAIDPRDRPKDAVLFLLARAHLEAFEGIDDGLPAAESASEIADSLRDQGLILLTGLVRAWCLARLNRHEHSLQLSETLTGLAIALQRPREQSIAMSIAAGSLCRLARFPEAVDRALVSAKLAEALADSYELCVAQIHASFGLNQLGRHQESVRLAQLAAGHAKQIDDTHLQAIALRSAANGLSRLRRDLEALETARRAASLAEEAGDDVTQAASLCSVASSLTDLRRDTEVVEPAEKAAELASRAGDSTVEGMAKSILGRSLSRLGNATGAINALNCAAEILEHAPDWGQRESLRAACNVAGSHAVTRLDGGIPDVSMMHSLLAAWAVPMPVSEFRFNCFRAWLEAFAFGAVLHCFDPDRLEGFAQAITLRFPARFGDLSAGLAAAAHYHRGGRDPALLARIDPDFSRVLQAMFPPAAPQKAKSERKVAARPKR